MVVFQLLVCIVVFFLLFFFISQRSGYSFQVLHRCSSNEYHNLYFCGSIRKISRMFAWNWAATSENVPSNVCPAKIQINLRIRVVWSESRGGWVRQRCPVALVTGPSNWYWLTVGQGLLSLQQVRVGENVIISSVPSFSFISLFFPFPSLSSPLLSLLSLFYLSLVIWIKFYKKIRIKRKNTLSSDGRNFSLTYFYDFYTRLKSLKWSFVIDVII